MKRKYPQGRFTPIGDILGWYDVFTVRQAIALCAGSYPTAQAVRDALSAMVKHGALERVAPGVYRWTYGRG